MLLTLYLITAILIFSGLQPLTIAGISFGMCFLPGLTFFTILKKDNLKLEDLILSYPVSIGVSSFSTLCLLSAGLHVKFIAYIIIGMSAMITAMFTIKDRKSVSLHILLSGGDARFLFIALLLTLMFSIPVISERIAISAHGFHHLSMVSRIFNGIFPPENPAMGGTAISYHWGYHAFVAALSFPSDFHPLRIFSLLNIVSLFFILCIAYRSAKSLGISEGYSYLVPLALIGLMRSDAIIFYVQKLYTGIFPPMGSVGSPPLNLLTSWVKGVSYLDTRLFFMSKFYNANNMPLGICLLLAFFLVLLLLVKEKTEFDHQKIYLLSLTVILVALAINYAFFLIIPLIFVPLWAAVLFFSNPGSNQHKIRELLHLIVPCMIAALIVSPYIYSISSGESVITAGKSMSEIKFIYLNIQVIKNLIIFLLPSPFIIAGLWVAFKRLGFSRRFYFLVSGTLICLLLSIFLRLMWYNSAKFSFILSFFFSIFFVFTVQYLLSLITRQWLSRCALVCIAGFLLSTPILTEAAYIYSSWFKDTTYAFRGRHVIFAKDTSRNEAYEWLRENTPSNTLLMLPYVTTPHAERIAQLFTYRPVALSERSLFVINDVYAFISPEYKIRVNLRKKLFDNPRDSQVREYINGLHRPVYLLIEEGYKDDLMEDVERDHIPDNSKEKFVLEFQNKSQKVYRIKL